MRSQSKKAVTDRQTTCDSKTMLGR